MENNLVRYRHEMNTIAFGKLEPKELDLFFSFVYKLKLMGTREIVLSFAELRELCDYKSRGSIKFENILKKVYKKIINLSIIEETKDTWTEFILFTSYTINRKSSTVSITVNDKFEYILNKISGDREKGEFYNKFQLQQLKSIEGKYAKTLFVLMKQWSSNHKLEISLDEFRRILSVPETYRMTHITTKILKPSIEELQSIFLHLKVEKIKYGREVIKFIFTWGAEILENETEEIFKETPISFPKNKIEYGEQINMFAEEKKIKSTVERPKSKEEIKKTLEGYLKESSLKKDSSILDEEREEDNTKDKFPPNDFLNSSEENNEINYIPLEECSPEMKKLSKKIEKEQKENEQLNDFSKEISLAITQLKKEIASASLFFKKILQTELADFEKKSQEWHWLFTGLDYNTLSLDHLKQFNELTKFFEDKLGLSISETVLEKCVSHVQESPINSEGKGLDSTALKNLISIKDIPEEKLLSKSGKNLVGGALISRLKKIAKELGNNIELEDGRLILA